MAEVAHLIALVHAAGGQIERRGDGLELVADAPLPRDLVARLRAAKSDLLAYLHETIAEPVVILADGRRLYRFAAETRIPRQPPQHLLPLIEYARSFGVALVADGTELVMSRNGCRTCRRRPCTTYAPRLPASSRACAAGAGSDAANETRQPRARLAGTKRQSPATNARDIDATTQPGVDQSDQLRGFQPAEARAFPQLSFSL